MSPVDRNFAQILRGLKAAIKGRGFTYKKLAGEMGMSEAGLKRLLNAKDCSLGRILKICQVIGISAEDLFAISEQIDEEVQDFSSAQVELFESSLAHLRYYKLRVEWLSPERIAAELGLAPKENRRFLLDLDKVNLIRLQGEKVEVPGRENVRWRRAGKAMRKLKYEFTEDLLRYFRDEGGGEGYYPIYHLQMSNAARQDLYLELDQLVERFLKRCKQENIALKPAQIRPLNIAFLLAPITGFARNRGQAGRML